MELQYIDKYIECVCLSTALQMFKSCHGDVQVGLLSVVVACFNGFMIQCLLCCVHVVFGVPSSVSVCVCAGGRCLSLQ